MKHFNLLVLVFFTIILFSCSSNDTPTAENIKPITYELLDFEFIQQTSTNEESLSYKIEFFNSNNFVVNGVPQITITIGGGATSTSVPNGQCQTIGANNSCTLTYSVVDDDPNLFPVEPIEFVKADYVLE